MIPCKEAGRAGRGFRCGLAIAVVLGSCAGANGPGPVVADQPGPTDPARVVPLDRIAPDRRESVAEVLADPSFHRQGEAETFPCHARLYLSLLNEPALTLALWKDLSESPAKLRQVAPGRYEGQDGAGTTATWEYVYRSPRLHVLYCDLRYRGPRGNAKLDGRIVLVVRSGYFKEVNGAPWVQHDVEAFVKIDTKGWRAVAVTVKPLIEKLLEDQVREAGWFVSLMGRLVASYPDWAGSVVVAQSEIPVESRRGFAEVVQQTRAPDASPGRPVLAANGEVVRR